MPYSYPCGKPDAIEFICKNTTTESKILDVGPGVGTYADLLKSYGYSIDALEIYEGYVEAYDLKKKYRN
jgi:2-polyprenyl-3-methyl-5-hydroxy-6-metoxy-1,4-benzoquinol methylase